MALSLSGERPHAAAMPASPLSALRRWVAKLQAARTRRIALTALLELDQARLNDLGIDRQDVLEVMRANGLALSVKLNAARSAKAQL